MTESKSAGKIVSVVCFTSRSVHHRTDVIAALFVAHAPKAGSLLTTAQKENVSVLGKNAWLTAECAGRSARYIKSKLLAHLSPRRIKIALASFDAAAGCRPERVECTATADAEAQ